MKSKNIILNGSVGLLVVAIAFGGWFYYRANKFYFAPRTESNLFALGQIEASKGRYAEAVKVYQELLSKDPKHGVAMRFMIESMMKMDDRSQIFPALDKLIAMDPSKDNLEYAASISLQLKDKERSEGYMKQLKKIEK